MRPKTSRNSRAEGLALKNELPRLINQPLNLKVLENIVSDYQRYADLSQIRHIQHVFPAERRERHYHHVELAVVHRLQLPEIIGPLDATIARRVYSSQNVDSKTAQHCDFELRKGVKCVEPRIQCVQRAEKQNRAAQTIAGEEMMHDAGCDAFLTGVGIGEEMSHLIFVERLQNAQNPLVLKDKKKVREGSNLVVTNKLRVALMEFVALILVLLESGERRRQRQLFIFAPLLGELHNVVDLVHFALFALQQLGPCRQQTQRIAGHRGGEPARKPAARLADILSAVDVIGPKSAARTEPRSLLLSPTMQSYSRQFGQRRIQAAEMIRRVALIAQNQLRLRSILLSEPTFRSR